MIMLSKKDIVLLNREFEGGTVVNEGSLDYAVAMTKRSKNWIKSAAILVRAILIDHVFADGNKRTTAAIIMTYIQMNGFQFEPRKVDEIVVRLLKENTTDVRKIERFIKHAII